MKIIELLGGLLFSGEHFINLLVLALLLLSVTIGVIGLNYTFNKNLRQINEMRRHDQDF